MTSGERIDVHQHVVPTFWADGLPARGGDPSGGHSLEWSPQSAIDFMDSQQIAAGILSLTASDVVGWKPSEHRDMARRVNGYTAATLPFLDVDGALGEIEHAFDTLKVEGVILLSNFAGTYLGDPTFEAVWAELDRRAVVFIHPGKPAIPTLAGVPGSIVDYPFDTTRAAIQMVSQRADGPLSPSARDSLARGGFLPYAPHRFAELRPVARRDSPTTEELLVAFPPFYFDTVLSSPAALPSLKAFAGAERMLFGSDYPYAPAAVGTSFTERLDAYPDLTEAERACINHGNALRLFERLNA